MTELSPGHKFTPVEDHSLERLLDLDGVVMEVGKGFWVEIKAQRVEPTSERPHGIDYSLCFYKPDKTDGRLICYDNAHQIKVGSGPARHKTETCDHVHNGEAVKPYDYKNAETLLEDFWTDVDQILKKEGIP